MTKLRDLERHLRSNGCEPLRDKHSVWHNPATERRTAVPRHTEIPRTTVREICKQLGVGPVE